MLLLILVLIIAVAEADYNIIGKFPYCYPKDQIFEIDFQNGLLFNSLNLLRLNEDEFQFININGEPMIIFSNNGLLFTTTCKDIHEIFIPSFFSDCTIHLPVYYLEGNNKNIVFLTKSGILRNYSSISECREEHVFYVGKKAITMFNKTAKISDNKLINVFIFFL